MSLQASVVCCTNRSSRNGHHTKSPMRSLLRLTFALSLFVAAASAQTFTVDQPKSNANRKAAARPGEVSVTPDAKTAKKSRTAAPKIEESAAAPSAAATRKRHVTKRAAKAAPKKPLAAAPAPVEEAVSTPPPPRPVAKGPDLQPVPSLTALNNQQLQDEIEKALRSNANTPSAQGVHVAVTDTDLTLTGTIASGREKVDAVRLAQSYSGNRLFKDELKVADSRRVMNTQPTGSNTGVPNSVGNGTSSQQPK